MSVVNTELRLQVKRVILMIFSIDSYGMKCNTFILKRFLQFTCTNSDGSQKERGIFLNLLQKERVTQKGGKGWRGGGGVTSIKVGGSSPGGSYDYLKSQ